MATETSTGAIGGETAGEGLDPNVARFTILAPMLTAHRLVSLVEGLESQGLMDSFGEGVDEAQFAQLAGCDKPTAAAIIDALRVGDVVETDAEDRFRLTPQWRALLSPNAFTPFGTLVSGARIDADALRRITSGDSYWEMSSSDRLALAAGVSPDPMAGGFTRMVQMMAAQGHPFASSVASARRYLELGCGLAGALLSGAVAFPNLQSVGVELSDDLADEAERRAELLGVTDRVRIVRENAADFQDPEPFDVGFWSQFFFPEPAREPALHTLFTHVRSGGIVAAPGRYCGAGDEVSAAVAQDYALFRVNAQSWGIPERSAEQVAAEFESVGFESPTTLANGPGLFMIVATRP